jgi:nucleotide-binding universal stress UspA family protein
VEAGLTYLQRTATRLQEAGVSPAALRTAGRIGDPAHELLAQAAREQATILVAARRTAGALASATPSLHRSVTAHLLQHAPLPVLLVPAA